VRESGKRGGLGLPFSFSKFNLSPNHEPQFFSFIKLFTLRLLIDIFLKQAERVIIDVVIFEVSAL